MTGDLRQRADTREATEALADVLERWIARDPLLSRVRGSPLPHAALRSPVRGSHPDRPGDTRPPPISPVASPNERAAKRQRIAHSLGDGVAEALAAVANRASVDAVVNHDSRGQHAQRAASAGLARLGRGRRGGDGASGTQVPRDRRCARAPGPFVESMAAYEQVT